MLVLTLCGIMYVILAKNLFSKHFPKNAAFQFIVNPSTVFFISGMIVAKYREPSAIMPGSTISGNSTMRAAGSYNLLGNSETFQKDNSFVGLHNLEMRLISQIIQNYDNSTKWQLKFVDLPHSSVMNVAASYMLPMDTFDQVSSHISRVANVLVTDSLERVPAWVVVDLISMKVMQWSRGKFGVIDQPISEGDLRLAGEIALTDGNVTDLIREDIKEHGELEDVVPDAWDAGFVTNNFKDRIVQVFLFGVRRNRDGQTFASPFNFVVNVHLGNRNTVRSIEPLPLYQTSNNTNNMMHDMYTFWTPSMMSGVLSPNSVRSELYRFKGVHPMSQPSPNSFMVSSTEELQR